MSKKFHPMYTDELKSLTRKCVENYSEAIYDLSRKKKGGGFVMIDVMPNIPLGIVLCLRSLDSVIFKVPSSSNSP